MGKPINAFHSAASKPHASPTLSECERRNHDSSPAPVEDWWWYDDESDYTPVISGGLVATTRQWWTESGGFVPQLRHRGLRIRHAYTHTHIHIYGRPPR